MVSSLYCAALFPVFDLKPSNCSILRPKTTLLSASSASSMKSHDHSSARSYRFDLWNYYLAVVSDSFWVRRVCCHDQCSPLLFLRTYWYFAVKSPNHQREPSCLQVKQAALFAWDSGSWDCVVSTCPLAFNWTCHCASSDDDACSKT